MCLGFGRGCLRRANKIKQLGSFDRVFDLGCELPKRVFKTSVSNTFCVSSNSCSKKFEEVMFRKGRTLGLWEVVGGP